MTISLGRRLPGASSDLPGSRHGSGRSAGVNRAARAKLAPMPPYLVLLPVGFAEPGRSPGLLVSSYLAVSPLPRATETAEAVCFSVALSLPVTGRWALPTTAPCGVRTFLRGLSSGPRRHGPERPSGHPACHDPLSIVSPTGTFLHPFPPMRRGSHASVDANSPLQPPQGNLRDFSPKFPI